MAWQHNHNKQNSLAMTMVFSPCTDELADCFGDANAYVL